MSLAEPSDWQLLHDEPLSLRHDLLRANGKWNLGRRVAPVRFRADRSRSSSDLLGESVELVPEGYMLPRLKMVLAFASHCLF